MRVHGLHLTFTWATLLILFEPYHDMTESCFHDNMDGNVDTSAVEELHVHRGSNRRLKRLTQEVYKPLRIKTLYSLEHLSTKEQLALKQVLERAVRKITSLLSVIRNDGLLLLPRSACPAVFREGINKGKCAMIQSGYTGEYCMDRFKIPSAHLEGFAIYNMTDTEPYKIYMKNGTGLRNTDFVLYVTSKMTNLCNPFTAVHELFHALGFSNKLFDKFRKCDEVGVCEPWPQPIVRPVDGVMRLVTGAVVRQMSKHFNCSSESDFGGPLEVEGDSVTSHWDGLLMHSSIMGSKEQKPYQTLIDPISLAVFEDTGWYKVNYSQADKFMWGQDKGCSFGLPNFCKQHEGICLQNVTGCHHLRLSKARCNVNTKIPSSCGVFAADQIPCFITPVNSTSFDDETLSSSSRCFLSSLRPAHSYSSEKNASFLNLIGKCYERKCEKDQYYLRVNGGDWLLCVPESYIQVQGFEGRILCANYNIICSDFIHPEPQLEFVASSTPANLLTISQDIRTPWNRIEASVTYSLLEGGARPAKSFSCPVALVIGIIASIFVDFLS